MAKEEMKNEEVKEEKKIRVQKFTRATVEEDLTIQNAKDIIESQRLEIENLNKEIARKQECMAHYQAILDANPEE